MLDFKGAYSFLRFSKDNSVQSIIHHIKYRGSKQLAFQLGVWFASEVLFSIKDQVDTIVPVPLHAHKLKQRGYNQSAEIAFGISRVTGHPVSLWLQRNGKTETQTKLGRWERFENTAHEFRLRDQMCLANTRILLLDDIITTGATMTGTSVPLYRAGARNLTLAAVGLTQHI